MFCKEGMDRLTVVRGCNATESAEVEVVPTLLWLLHCYSVLHSQGTPSSETAASFSPDKEPHNSANNLPYLFGRTC